MKAVSTLIVATLLTLSASLVQAASLDLNINNDAAQFEASGNLFPGIELGGGVLSSDDSEDVTAAHVQLLATEATRDYETGVGARWSQYDTDYGNGGGLGIGGYGYAFLPTMPRLSLGGYGFYTPGVISQNELDMSLEVGLRARYRIVRNADVYVGYRRIEAEFDGSDEDRTLDSGPLAGVRLSF